MSKYDYSNATIIKSNKKRLYFYEKIFSLIETYVSTSEEVNELIGWLGIVLNINTELPSKNEKKINEYLKSDKKLNEYTYIRNVSTSDIRLYCIFATIEEYSSFQLPDSLTDITKKIYLLLDKVVHPYHRKRLDLEDVRYYVEVEYISKEKQKQIELELSVKYDDTEI